MSNLFLLIFIEIYVLNKKYITFTVNFNETFK